MLRKKILTFLRKLYFNPRLDWHKADLDLFSGCKKILDIGCGKGSFIELTPKRIIGIDRNWHSLKECLKKDCTVIKGDVLNLPFSSQSFDGAYCADLIEHFSPPDARSLLMEMLRILKAGGLLVVGTPLPSKMFWNDPSHVRPYPPHSLLSYCVKDTEKGMGTQPSYESLPYQMKFVKLIWRHTQFYQLPGQLYFNEERMKLANLIRPSSLLFMLSNLASRIGLNHPTPEGYIVVMQKV